MPLLTFELYKAAKTMLPIGALLPAVLCASSRAHAALPPLSLYARLSPAWLCPLLAAGLSACLLFCFPRCFAVLCVLPLLVPPLVFA